ncbi:MAG TPA: guanylate kinase [Armatimonadota bacterium]|nr:guanylate kinase [Armatimonadota bacterium]
MSTDAVLHRRGNVFILSAPSGTGKDTVIARALEGQDSIRRCVTVTTRPPAAGEVDAVNYFFRTTAEFERLKEQGELLEWAEVHKNFYGTPRWWVQEQVDRGVDVVLVIDIQGARQVRKRLEGVTTIFLAPPSLAELEQRIRTRARDDEESIRTRLHNARVELQCLPEYDYLIINDDLDQAVAELRAIFTAERLRLRPWSPITNIVHALLDGEPAAQH